MSQMQQTMNCGNLSKQIQYVLPLRNWANDYRRGSEQHERESPLHVACGNGNLQVVKALIEEGGFDVDLVHESKSHCPVGRFTPLKCAVQGQRSTKESAASERGGKLKVVQYLVGKGADLDWTDESKCSYLHFACQRSDLEMAEFLILHGGGGKTWRNKHGATPLQLVPTKVWDSGRRGMCENSQLEDFKKLFSKFD